jgi:hypothetical protein
MIEWVVGITIPVVGWALSVEQRLKGRKEIMSAIDTVEKKVDKLDNRQEELIDFLLRDRSRPPQG